MTDVTPYPLLFRPLLKERPWGGAALADLGKSVAEGSTIGESWEIADLPETVAEGRSVITNGPLADRTLREAIAEHTATIMGKAAGAEANGFPLLIKYLDAHENLSVQVHPTAAYVAEHTGAHVKSEAWVIVDAAPEAVVYIGVKPEVTAEQFRKDVDSGAVVDDLVAVPAKIGECFYLPSGTCHALGAGVVVAEVQTPSDTTFRVYDWGREDRDLHVAEAMQCITFGVETEPAQEGYFVEVGGMRTRLLVETGDFQIERVHTAGAAMMPVVLNEMPEVWMVIAGKGEIDPIDAPPVPLAVGTTVLLPAAMVDATVRLEPASSYLRITLPSPLKGKIA
jgi:mannose-6-phosphate isomerase